MKELSPYSITRNEPAPGSPPPWHSSQLFSEGVNFKEYWGVVLKYRTMIGSITLAAAIVVLAWYFGRTPQYKATSKILIQLQMPHVINELKDFLSEQTTGGDYDYYKTQYDLLKSDSLAARVIHENDLAVNPVFQPKGGPSFFRTLIGSIRKQLRSDNTASKPNGGSDNYGLPPAVIDRYLARLSVEPKKGTQLVIIGFTTPDPRLAAAITNAHVRTYIRQGLELHAQTGKNVEEFLRQKLIDLKDKVEQSEAALNKYRRDRGIVALGSADDKASGKASPLMQRLEELNSELTQASGKRITLETEHQLIVGKDYDFLPQVISNQVIQNLKEQVAQLSTQYASMSNRYNPGYHPLDDLNAKLTEQKHRLDQEVRAIAQSVDADYRAAMANEAKISDEITQAKAQALALNDASLHEAVLVREVEASRDLYRSVLQRMNEISVASEVPSSNVSVVDRAVPPRIPTGPSLPLLLLFSIAGSSFAGVALAFFLESMDDTFKSSQEVPRYLGLPSFGVVPDFSKQRGSFYGYRPYLSTRKQRRDAPALANGDAGESSENKELLVANGHFSTASEMYRTIRTAIMFSRAGGAPKIILVTSSSAGEGKTITACNIATAFAHTGNRTLLIDADLRRSRCHELLRVESGQGLSEVLVHLRDMEELVIPTKVQSLSLLAAGSRPPNPSELLASPEMKTIIEKTRELFDYVILDSAPVMPVSDSVGLSTMVDGVVVVAGGDTSRKLVLECCSRLGHVGAKILGVVLNRVDITGNSYYRYDHYSYYTSYKPTTPRPREQSKAENADTV